MFSNLPTSLGLQDSLRALQKSGALPDLQKRGIEHLSYFQVDNPLVHCIDPLFLGLHDLSQRVQVRDELSDDLVNAAACDPGMRPAS